MATATNKLEISIADRKQCKSCFYSVLGVCEVSQLNLRRAMYNIQIYYQIRLHSCRESPKWSEKYEFPLLNIIILFQN